MAAPVYEALLQMAPPKPLPKEFRPKVAIWLSLPAAMFWSIVATAKILPSLPTVPPFSIAETIWTSYWGGFVAALLMLATPVSNILAMGYGLYRTGKDAVRRGVIALSLVSIVALVGILSRPL
jgi:hypothetical protein